MNDDARSQIMVADAIMNIVTDRATGVLGIDPPTREVVAKISFDLHIGTIFERKQLALGALFLVQKEK